MRASATPVYIYALVDPRSQEVRYVGKTSTTPESRLRGHLCRTNLTPKRHSSRWLAGLVADGLKPDLRVLEIIQPGGDWEAAERHWIADFRSRGANLTNLTDGGEGVQGYKMPPEQRAHMSRVMKGRIFDEEWRANLSKAMKGRKLPSPTPETTEKRRVSHAKTMRKRAEERTHCKNGHELVGDNVISDGPTSKRCRECARQARRDYYLKHRPELKTPEEISAIQREAAMRPNVRRAHSEAQRKIWRDPAYLKRRLPDLMKASKMSSATAHLRSGEKHPNAKLTWDKVDAMRERVAAGESRRLVGQDYGVALTTVDQIIQGKSWKLENHPDSSRREAA